MIRSSRRSTAASMPSRAVPGGTPARSAVAAMSSSSVQQTFPFAIMLFSVKTAAAVNRGTASRATPSALAISSAFRKPIPSTSSARRYGFVRTICGAASP